MRTIDCHWYKTYVEGEENEARACVNIDDLSAALPHGSGIDGDWYIFVAKNGNVHARTEYHRMNEHGSYCGWIPVNVILRRATRDNVRELCGPCAGQTQTLWRKGDVVFSLRARAEDADYLHETVFYALKDAGLAIVC